jgi:heterodisulfide reductase subunit C
MNRTLNLNRLDTAFAGQVEQLSGQRLNLCYQCGKCTAGCPIAYSVEFPPHKIMRMCQLGLKQRVLSSPTIWLCLSCVTCTARCPKEVDLAHIMNVLRELAIQEGVVGDKQPRIKLFNQFLLDSVYQYGRLYEMGTLAKFNMRCLNPFHDIELLPHLLKKGKLGILPRKIKGTQEVQRIFDKSCPKGD